VKIEYYLLLGSSPACEYKVSTFRKRVVSIFIGQEWLMAVSMVVYIYILRAASLDRYRASQGEGCGGGGQVGERANGWVEGNGEA
jgi:hypothetical protein